MGKSDYEAGEVIQLSKKYQNRAILVFAHVHRLHMDPLAVQSTKASALLGLLALPSQDCPAPPQGGMYIQSSL